MIEKIRKAIGIIGDQAYRSTLYSLMPDEGQRILIECIHDQGLSYEKILDAILQFAQETNKEKKDDNSDDMGTV